MATARRGLSGARAPLSPDRGSLSPPKGREPEPQIREAGPAPEETSPGVTLGDGLIAARIRPAGPLPASAVRLDRENISSVGKLRRLAEIHSLYLQRNRIEKIENLDSFPNLRFLCLAGNRIQRVQNLQALPHLSALDLSHNRIRVLDAEELPRSLQILDLTGNECTRQEGYRALVVAALPHLLQLDSQPIHGNTAGEEAGGSSSSSKEEEEDDEEPLPEPSIPFTADRDFFADLHRELAGRARRRRRDTLEEHWARLEELWERRALLLGPERDGAAGAATPRRCRLRPQAKAGARPSPPPASGGCQRAPGGIQLPAEALEKEAHAEGAGDGQLSQISRSSSAAPRSRE